MKKHFIWYFVMGLILCWGCTGPRYVTEKYIKTRVEPHITNAYSSVKLLHLYTGKCIGTESYLELTGYKKDSTKYLIVAADRYFMARKKIKSSPVGVGEVTFIQLTPAQCQAFIDNYQVLQVQIKPDKPGNKETYYRDFTISDDLFISLRKGYGGEPESQVDLWIKGERYTTDARTLLRNIQKFLTY